MLPDRELRLSHGYLARHRRRGLHRLQLRAAGARADRRAHGRARQAHLRRQPREPRRRRRASALPLREGRHRRPRGGRPGRSASTGRGDPQLRGRDATSTARSTSPSDFVRTNVVGAFELLEAARRQSRSSTPPRAGASASCTSRPTRSTARSARPAPSARRPPTSRTRPYSASKAAPITWCAPSSSRLPSRSCKRCCR